MANDGTIGNAASGGTARANADTQALFTLLWTNVSNTYAPVSGGRGASALADFNANKTIALTKMLGRALGIAGAGSGLTSRALGLTLGEEAHTPTLSEMFNHTHAATVTDSGHGHTVLSSNIANTSHIAQLGGTDGLIGGTDANNGYFVNATPSGLSFVHTSTTGITVANANQGSSTAFNVMQPTSFVNIMIKL